MTTRRTFLAGAGLSLCAGTASGALAETSAAEAAGAVDRGTAPRRARGPALPDLAFATREPFLDRERASRVLAQERLDALVLGHATNVFHASNFYPLLDRMSFRLTALAVVPRDPRRPVALVVPSFSYYYIQADDGLVPGVQPFVFTSPAGYQDAARTDAEPPAADARPYPVHDPELLTMRERRRRDALAAAAPYAPNVQWALARACRELGLGTARIGYDEAGVAPLLARAVPGAAAVEAEDTPRRLRLVRTPAEIRMMRLAAQNNVDAALATIRAARDLGSLAALRQRFYAEAALRGNIGVFMVVDAVSSDAYDEPLRDGRSFMIDCVSHCRNFHGDYGRTIFVGEPTARMRRCTEAMSKGWDEIRPRLRPGVKFSEIRALGQQTLAKLGYDVPVGFGPHSVGLAHNDQPRTAPGGGPVDHVLESGMILSIDCPLLEAGNGGTAHLEDLVLVTAQGGEPIHDTGAPTYTI
jgi:Xaa-Pro aminopeptidase